MRTAIEKTVEASKLSRFAQLTLEFGLAATASIA